MIFGYKTIKEFYSDIERLQEIEGVDIDEEMKVKSISYSFENKENSIGVFAKGNNGKFVSDDKYITIESETLSMDIDYVEYIELNTNKLGMISEIKIEFAHKHFMYLYF